MGARKVAWNNFMTKIQELDITEDALKEMTTADIKDLLVALDFNPIHRAQVVSEFQSNFLNSTTTASIAPQPSAKNGFKNRMVSDDVVQTHELPPANLFPPDFRPSVAAHQSLKDLDIFSHDAIISWCMKRVEVMRSAAKKYSLSDDEVLSLVLYTYDIGLSGKREENIYYKVNHTLRFRAVSMVKWRDFIWYLLSALRKLPLYNGEVFRGVNANLTIASYQKGKQVRWNAFTSASMKKSVAEKFMSTKHGDMSPYLFMLDVTGGRLISEFSAVPDEAEVLLPPESSFKVERLIDFSVPTILVMQQVHHESTFSTLTLSTKPSIQPATTTTTPTPNKPNINFSTVSPSTSSNSNSTSPLKSPTNQTKTTQPIEKKPVQQNNPKPIPNLALAQTESCPVCQASVLSTSLATHVEQHFEEAEAAFFPTEPSFSPLNLNVHKNPPTNTNPTKQGQKNQVVDTKNQNSKLKPNIASPQTEVYRECPVCTVEVVSTDLEAHVEQHFEDDVATPSTQIEISFAAKLFAKAKENHIKTLSKAATKDLWNEIDNVEKMVSHSVMENEVKIVDEKIAEYRKQYKKVPTELGVRKRLLEITMEKLITQMKERKITPDKYIDMLKAKIKEERELVNKIERLRKPEWIKYPLDRIKIMESESNYTEQIRHLYYGAKYP